MRWTERQCVGRERRRRFGKGDDPGHIAYAAIAAAAQAVHLCGKSPDARAGRNIGNRDGSGSARWPA